MQEKIRGITVNLPENGENLNESALDEVEFALCERIKKYAYSGKAVDMEINLLTMALAKLIKARAMSQERLNHRQCD